MVRGIHTAAAGMSVMQSRMDIISNNMANVDLTSFKKDVAVMKSFPDIQIRRGQDDGLMAFPLGSYDTMPVVGKLGTGVELNESFTVWEQGSLKETENDFDLALDGKGFMAVESERGERYTRNGSFTLDKEGFLVTKEGLKVLSEDDSHIQIKENNFAIDKEGKIYVNKEYEGDPNRLVKKDENEWKEREYIGTLKIVRFPRERELRREGTSFYYADEFSGSPIVATGNKRPQVLQGFKESSNVNVVSEMVQMIEVQRLYDANQKSIQSHDSLLSKSVNQVGIARG